jgi:hypothetical protein
MGAMFVRVFFAFVQSQHGESRKGARGAVERIKGKQKPRRSI